VGKLNKAPAVLGTPWVATAITFIVAMTLAATDHPNAQNTITVCVTLLVLSAWSTFAYCGGYADGKDTK
tara:strand:- start:131 stop:337 length:207 start_codon:yes stop_codon:yes gene_type:complete